MRVLVDAQPLLGIRTGIGRYVSSLVEQAIKPQEIEVCLAFNRVIKPIEKLDFVKEHVQALNTRYPYKVIRRLFGPNFLYDYPIDLFLKEKFDLFHGTNFTVIPTMKAKSIVTIHDLAYMKYPETTSEKIYKHHTKWVPFSVERSDCVIAVSEQTKRDLIDLLCTPEDKIHVIQLAAHASFRPLKFHEYEYVYQKYQLPKKYILYVGTIEPRKNLSTLFHAYAAMKKEMLCQEKLIIVGAKGWKYSSLFALIDELQLEDDVIFIGYVEEEDLPAIYNGATCVVLPSLYEGFGLPLLEAMQCGIPVLCSNVSSIPEVVGGAGLLIDPKDVNGWATSIGNVIIDSDLRRTLVCRSLERAKCFSWEKVAKETIEVYHKAIDGG